MQATGTARTDDKGGFTMLHVYAQADDAQTLIELGMATIHSGVESPYPHLIALEMAGNPQDWEPVMLRCDEDDCIAYRIPDPEHAQCGWLISHDVIQRQPALVWRALERWVYVQPVAVAVS